MLIVKNKKPCIWSARNGRFFYPGNNVITTDEEADALMGDDAFNAQIALGSKDKHDGFEIVELDEEVEQVQPKEPHANVNDDIKERAEAISKMNVAGASKVIGDLLEIKVLNELAEIDQRVGVQKAVAAQIKKLEEAGEPESNDDEE